MGSGVLHAPTPPRVTLWDMQWGMRGKLEVSRLAARSLLACRGQQGLEGGSATTHSAHMH